MHLEPIRINEAWEVGASISFQIVRSSYIDRLIVGAVVGSQNEPARSSWEGAPGKAPRAVKIETKSFSDLLRTPYGTQERLKAVPMASRARLGASPASPRSTQMIPEVALVALKGAPRSFGSVPRRRKWRLRHTRDEKRRAFGARLARKASSERWSLEFSRFCTFLPRLRTL